MSKLPFMFNERELSKKEIRVLKELTTTRGPEQAWQWLKNPKYSYFIHELFASFSRKANKIHSITKTETGIRLRTFISQLFNIPDHWSERTRGQEQKLTYRTNRFEETIGNIQYKLDHRSAELEQNILWIVDLHRMVDISIPHRNNNYYLSNFIIMAKNKLEAQSLAITMIGDPLGSNESVSNIRALGHPAFFDYASHNLSQTTAMLDSFEQEIIRAENTLIKAKKNKEKISYVSAIVSQAGMMINGSI